MLRKFVASGLVGLFLVMSFAVAENNIGPYNSFADVNKDGKVDMLDLVEVGQAYGSNYTLRSETNKTVVMVVSFARSPPEIEGALVMINPDKHWNPGKYAITNSSGIAVFGINPNSTYRVFAWSGSAYNYVDFTTNSYGEASVLITLGEPSIPVIRNLPNRTLLFTFRDNITNTFFSQEEWWDVDIRIWHGGTPGGTWSIPYDQAVWGSYIQSPACTLPVPEIYNGFYPNKAYLVAVSHIWPAPLTNVGYGVFEIDSNGCANVVIYGNFSG